MSRTLTRRALLGGSAALAVAGAATACTPTSGAPTPSTSSATGLTLPAYVPFADVRPDLAGTAAGVPQGFFTYPTQPALRPGFPLTGIDRTTALFQADKAMAARADNPWWQGIERGIGTQLDAATVPGANYREKFQVTMAGGDLPDLVQIVTVPQLPALLDKGFADLTEHLGGDAVKDYPGLASLPTDSWRLAVVDGKLRGVVQPRPAGGRVVNFRGDLFAGFGIAKTPQLNSGEDFLALCREVTDPARSIFAMGATPTSWALFVVLEMMGAPNLWAETGGTFSHLYEAPQMKDALAVVQKMFSEKLLHPESASKPANNLVWWTGGVTSMYIQDFAGWPRYARDHPDWRLGALTLPKWDGGGPAPKHLGSGGYPNFVAIRKVDDQRIAQLLRLLDYVASPFGTQQFLDVNFGSADADYTLDDGNPVPTKEATNHAPQGLLYAGSQGYTALYDPTNTEQVQGQHAYLSAMMPTGVRNAAQGLYSEAAVTSGATAALALVNVQSEIILGRQPMSDWDAAVKTWQSASGDQQRRELEEALQQQG